jgi:hypothetical protein
MSKEKVGSVKHKGAYYEVIWESGSGTVYVKIPGSFFSVGYTHECERAASPNMPLKSRRHIWSASSELLTAH